jgi:tRNA modification GTPase
MDFDTIAAISTPLGEGGIAVIRVSGPDSIHIVDKVYQGKKSLSEAKTHTIHYGYLTDPDSGSRFEEVLISVMRAPRTFTKEDVVEVHCHGGLVASKRVLDVLLEVGARLADPGEFTKRAFLNGRLDLSQAEAVIDVIRSKTDRAMNVAIQQVSGRLSRKVESLRHEIIRMMAHIEVTIDYPEHDVEELTYTFLKEEAIKVIGHIDEMLMTAKQGKILREGISTAIIGRPNVGKSSLLNALIQDNRAIVSDIPGTTRDVIEEYVQVRGIPLKLIDTAGIRETEDVIERIGVERSRKVLSEADLILLVINSSEPLTDDDLTLIEFIKNMQTIVIANKIDLPIRMDLAYVKAIFPNRVVTTSVIEDEGLDVLEKSIADLFFEGSIQGEDYTYVSNSRHIALLRMARKQMGDVVSGIDAFVPVDMIQIDLKSAWESLGEVIGDSVSEDLIDQIFSQFCLGK